MTWNWKTFAIPSLIGAVILIVGLAISSYTDSVIEFLQGVLREGSLLSQAQRDYFQGMYEWWTLAKVTFYHPIAYLLIVIGVIVLVSSVFYSLSTIRNEAIK